LGRPTMAMTGRLAGVDCRMRDCLKRDFFKASAEGGKFPLISLEWVSVQFYLAVGADPCGWGGFGAMYTIHHEADAAISG
jgi:hypothetical protein